MATAGGPTCPICEKQVQSREANKAFPFCSERCRMADLGRWLNEEYRIPVQEPEDEGEGGGEGAVDTAQDDEP
jgi:endogenous inhibitor of DNA gyrase (YacG/DUF329 family)